MNAAHEIFAVLVPMMFFLLLLMVIGTWLILSKIGIFFRLPEGEIPEGKFPIMYVQRPKSVYQQKYSMDHPDETNKPVCQEKINLLPKKEEKVPFEGNKLEKDDDTPGETFYDHYKKGLVRLHEKKYQESIKHFDQSISMNPEYALAYEYRGEAYFWVGDRDKGMSDIKKSNQLKRGK